jgi:hypothetical protein
LVTFSRGFPTKRESFYIFAACVFPIHVWLIITVLREVPAWMMRVTGWDLIGIIAYSLVYGLIESVLVFGAVFLFVILLPIAALRHKIVAVASGTVFVSALWFVILHYNEHWIGTRQVAPLLAWLTTYLLGLGGFYLLVHRSLRVEKLVNAFVERVAVLSILYLGLDLLGLMIVIMRVI